MTQLACPNCGAPDTGNYCSNCGAALRPGEKALSATAHVVIGPIVDCLTFAFALLVEPSRVVDRVRNGAIGFPRLAAIGLASVSLTALISYLLPSEVTAGYVWPHVTVPVLAELARVLFYIAVVLVMFGPAYLFLKRKDDTIGLSRFVVLLTCLQFSIYPYQALVLGLMVQSASAAMIWASAVAAGLSYYLLMARGASVLFGRPLAYTLGVLLAVYFGALIALTLVVMMFNRLFHG